MRKAILGIAIALFVIAISMVGAAKDSVLKQCDINRDSVVNQGDVNVLVNKMVKPSVLMDYHAECDQYWGYGSGQE
jgi:outer membrane protein assembly factor BamE (lipoprotein component of BamABCDE complex)